MLCVFYGKSYTHIAIQWPCLPSCKQFIECAMFASLQSTVIKHTTRYMYVVSWPQPVGSLLLAQNAWHCTSIQSTAQGHNAFPCMWFLGHNQWGRSCSPKMRGIALVYNLLLKDTMHSHVFSGMLTLVSGLLMLAQNVPAFTDE